MSNFDPTIVRQAAAAFQAKHSARFENLVPWQDVISELRGKGASYQAIAGFLGQFGIQTSKSAIGRFCKGVLKESAKRRSRGRPKRPKALQDKEVSEPTQPQKQVADAELQPDETLPLFPAKSDLTFSSRRKRGPRIANIELIDD